MQQRSEQTRRSGNTIAFVPTMGYLHEGHLSLIRKARKLGDELTVSIFVNPTQFGPGEDLETYPRNLDRDLELVQKEKADIVFHPHASELYPEGFQTYVHLEELPNHLCGLSRPNFLKGVATIVTKLFNIVKPHHAVFGEKDFQQLTVIRRMVKDLHMDIQIIGGPTVRESDGLAMSSRNAYLRDDQRAAALSLFLSMKKATDLLAAGVTEASRLIASATQLITSHPETDIDYISICDPETFEDMEKIDRPALMALAVKIGTTRLIDNTMLTP
jgi:pantoate--beta-alanine ligase